MAVEGSGDDQVTGKPVGRGVVRGRARVARTLDEAAALEAGEILIAPITDVGWTPYFTLISGLATDVGSVVSHGAVVARDLRRPLRRRQRLRRAAVEHVPRVGDNPR